MKLTSRSFAEFTAPGNLFNYDKATRKWTHIASGVMTLNYVLSLKQSMDLVFAGTSHKKSRHDRREHVDRQVGLELVCDTAGDCGSLPSAVLFESMC